VVVWVYEMQESERLIKMTDQTELAARAGWPNVPASKKAGAQASPMADFRRISSVQESL
jgi:hypothetical protein